MATSTNYHVRWTTWWKDEIKQELCKNKIQLLDEQQIFPLHTRGLNLSVLKQLQPLHCYTQLFAAHPKYVQKNCRNKHVKFFLKIKQQHR
jgi:hypothetical protein